MHLPTHRKALRSLTWDVGVSMISTNLLSRCMLGYMYFPVKNLYTYCLLPYIFRALWEAVSWVPNKIEGLQVKSKLTVLKWCQMFLHWPLIIGVFVPLIKQKIISSSEKAPSSQGLPTEGWRPSKAKGLRKWPGNIKKRPHFTLLLSKTWIKHDRRVWSSKTSSGQTLIIPLKRHRPTAWHGTWVHSHLASTYCVSPATANQTVRHSGVPVHHFPKTDSAQELPGLQDLGLPVPHSPGPNRPHRRPHLSPSCLLGSHPSSCKILKATSLGPKPELMRTSWESKFHDGE